jgi:myo-inositol 2-dehydrogenase/D-chiro-inositol 1-dehydrogenase
VTLDIGVLGFASYYGPAFARRIADRADCEVVAASSAGVPDDALAELGRPTTDEFAAGFDCPVFDTVDPVFDAADALVVATATTRRPDDVVRALEQGIPVLCAKPVAADYAGARRVAEAAARSPAPAVFTTPARYDDAVASLGRRVADGDVGDVLAVRAAIRHDRVPAAGIEANAEHAPGSTHAMAVYVADALLWLAPSRPVRVSAEYVTANTPHSAHPDLGTALTRFEDGVLGTTTMTYSTDCREAWGNWEVEVVGTDGVLRTAHQGYEGVHWRAGPPDERSATVFGRTTSPVLDRTLDAFRDAVDGARPAHVPDADHVAAAHALCEAWKTAADGSPRRFDSWPPAPS